MASFASWNVRGLNNPIKQVEIRRFFQAYRLSLVGIVETKLRKENLDSAMKKCLPLVGALLTMLVLP